MALAKDPDFKIATQAYKDLILNKDNFANILTQILVNKVRIKKFGRLVWITDVSKICKRNNDMKALMYHYLYKFNTNPNMGTVSIKFNIHLVLESANHIYDRLAGNYSVFQNSWNFSDGHFKTNFS